eukprot:2719935-Ditylum_brightwellii.AAC.1
MEELDECVRFSLKSTEINLTNSILLMTYLDAQKGNKNAHSQLLSWWAALSMEVNAATKQHACQVGLTYKRTQQLT